jgi:hypothetical protein
VKPNGEICEFVHVRRDTPPSTGHRTATDYQSRSPPSKPVPGSSRGAIIGIAMTGMLVGCQIITKVWTQGSILLSSREITPLFEGRYVSISSLFGLFVVCLIGVSASSLFRPRRFACRERRGFLLAELV